LILFATDSRAMKSLILAAELCRTWAERQTGVHPDRTTVVIAIIAILAALLLPHCQGEEQVGRIMCMNTASNDVGHTLYTRITGSVSPNPMMATQHPATIGAPDRQDRGGPGVQQRHPEGPDPGLMAPYIANTSRCSSARRQTNGPSGSLHPGKNSSAARTIS